MNTTLAHALRRRLHRAGGRSTHAPSEAQVARGDEPRIRVATVVEPPLRAIPVRAATPWDAPVAFLDGIQRTRLLGSHGVWPVVLARIAAGVRRREGRRLVGAVHAVRDLVVGPAVALAAMADLADRVTTILLDDSGGGHPLAMRDAARAAVDRARAALEIEVGAVFRRTAPDAWLAVDGPLTVSPDWAADPRMIGLVKSHTTLPFEGEDLERYLTLPAGHRSSVFQPPTRSVAPVYAFGLRLHDWRGRDLMYGLLRVERPATAESLADADLIAARLLAERAPVAADPRSDRLLYGVHAVERWLGALG
jgi:hypothetical protein